MKLAMIAAWKMSHEALLEVYPMLKSGSGVKSVLEKAICIVEDNPANRSVGYGSLPNALCELEFDAAYMSGDTLDYGGVIGARNVKNPIKVAIDLSGRKTDRLLCGKGAESYAARKGFEFANMLNDFGRDHWERHRDGSSCNKGHDTVCMAALDNNGSMAVGVSTSGLAMKQPGRVGDSPIIGSGFYCDSRYGGAAATGLGEDIMKGCLSKEIVNGMKNGQSAQAACENATLELYNRLIELGQSPGPISAVALDKNGGFGAATTLKEFAFSVFNEDMEPTLYICHNVNGEIRLSASEADVARYTGD